jgi:riboflavin kinase / FMN adenylyltransferase
MLIIEDNFNTKLKEATFIALGSFDGIHLGHLKLIKKVVELANRSNSNSMIFTFKNHPLTVINKEIAPKLLMTNEKKQEILKKLGIDIVNFATFDDVFMKISPEDFIKKMIEFYGAKGFVVGFNYRFGYKNLGDIDLLTKLSTKLNFKVYVVSPVKYNKEIVSSSRIRNVISEDGDIQKAIKMMTRPYLLRGKVIKGKQLGRRIGFPTVNLDYDKSFVLPKGGVYYTVVRYHDKCYRGITNVGYNPTVENDKLSIETHILNFASDIYSEYIELKFIKRLRDEKKFDSILELMEQLKKDKLYAEKQDL